MRRACHGTDLATAPADYRHHGDNGGRTCANNTGRIRFKTANIARQRVSHRLKSVTKCRDRSMALPAFALIVVLSVASPAGAQSSAALQGQVFDAAGVVLPGAIIRLHNDETGFDRSTDSDAEGRYHLGAIPAGSYEVTTSFPGFKSVVIAALTFEVGRTVVRDIRLEVGDISQSVTVTGEVPLVDRATTSVGHVVTAGTVQEIPLNGRHFTDLALVVPGSVAPSQAGFSARPIRGVGTLAFNTAGNREEAVAFQVNGVTTNNLTFGSLGFQPPLDAIREFRVDNSVFAAEHGHVSGAVVNLVTRSGTDQFHGSVFEFLRNDALDARNFFETTSSDPSPFTRHQFGGAVGGPLVRDRAFFFATLERLRQRENLTVNSLVLSDEQRRSTDNPMIRRLIELIPPANVVDAGGTPRFVGSAPASVDNDIWSAHLSLKLGDRDRLEAFIGSQWIETLEPTTAGNTIPGFGHVLDTSRGLLTINETRIIGDATVNEARVGLSSLEGTATPSATLNPADFGIGNGVTVPIGLPQISVAGGLNLGGPAGFPQGRDDALYVFANTVSSRAGRHSMKLGAEYRRFVNDNFAQGTGAFNFPTVAAFMSGQANAFSITLGERRNHIRQSALGVFFQDAVTVRSNLTVDVGLRYEWHMTPTERDDRFVVFDAASESLLRVGVDVDEIYKQNNRNVEPRVGIAWDLSAVGSTVVRAAYGWSVDEPSTTAVRDTTANPPFATPLAASDSIDLGRAIERARPAGLSPATVEPALRNASLQSWNVNVQQQLTSNLAVMAGYFGSHGSNLRISRNLNQPVNGVRPFSALSPGSPILPGAPLGNITQVESSGYSNYHGLWLSAKKRLGRGLQFDSSYTWSKSLDTNSLNSLGFAVQNSYDIPNQYGLSDFDARQRFVLCATYELPFAGHVLVRGWQVVAMVQSQSGNPVNLVTGNSTLNGIPNTVRPDITGPVRIIGSVDQWFDTSAFEAVDHFGNLGRNVIIGPGFNNTDLSVVRNMRFGKRIRLQVRADVFNLFNHANFGSPGDVVGSPTFGKITRTRLTTGEAGSSRQIQLAARLTF
jgi:hypothetical protein